MATVTVPLDDGGNPRRHPQTGRIWPHLELDEGESAIQTDPTINDTITLPNGHVYDLRGLIENIVIVSQEDHDELLSAHERLYAALHPDAEEAPAAEE